MFLEAPLTELTFSQVWRRTHAASTRPATWLLVMAATSGLGRTAPEAKLSVRGTSGLGISDSHIAFGANQVCLYHHRRKRHRGV